MDEEQKRLIAADKKKRYAFYKRIEAANLLAQADIDQIDDVPQWMEGVPQWLNETEKEVCALPNTLEQKIPILNLIKAARKTYLNNEPMLTRRFINEIEENWNNAMHDKGLVARLNAKIGRVKAGNTRKEQLEEQSKETINEVIKLYQESKLPLRNRATKIAEKLRITSARVRQILRKEEIKAKMT